MTKRQMPEVKLLKYCLKTNAPALPGHIYKFRMINYQAFLLPWILATNISA